MKRTMTAMILTGLMMSALASQAEAADRKKPKCKIKTTIVAFVSSSPRQIQFCKFDGQVQGREEFIAGCSSKFRIDGMEYEIEGKPDMFGIVTLNLDRIAPVMGAANETSVQIASSEPVSAKPATTNAEGGR